MRSKAVSFAAGLLAPFTVAVVGEEPVGELILVAVSFWALLCLAYNRAWPGPLLRHPFCLALLGAQALATLAYVASDLYRGSSSHDALRGWSRMIFLGLDLIAVAYLFGRSPRNFLFLQAGVCAGGVVQALVQGPLFGDMWKFGVGTPLTYLGIFLAPWGGPLLAAAGAVGLGVLNFVLDYRSLGGLCLFTGLLTLVQAAPRGARKFLAPGLLAAAAAAVTLVYARTENVARADRSDIERSSMMTAAAEAFAGSPLIGQGSWFSNTRVYDDFLLLQATRAKEAHVGGVQAANTEPDDTAFHSQILVALAEGGIFGGSFFILYAGGMACGLYQLIFVRPWDRMAPFLLFFLLMACWDLVFSPFSGAHRLGIAQAGGLILLILNENRTGNAVAAADRR